MYYYDYFRCCWIYFGDCGCKCGCNCNDSGGGGDEPVTPGSKLTPTLVDSSAQCDNADPKKLIISGTGGTPGSHVHVWLRRSETGFSLKYPEKDSDENLVDSSGNWTTVLRLDSNTKNVNAVNAGQYNAEFSETNAQGVEIASSKNEISINISQCEKAELKFDFQDGATLECVDGILTITGYGAGANEEINIVLIRPVVPERTMHARGVWSEADGSWIFDIDSAEAGWAFGDTHIPTGYYEIYAYQTHYDGFMRESERFEIRIENCLDRRMRRSRGIIVGAGSISDRIAGADPISGRSHRRARLN
ncbi:MAG: hypothetical protein LBB86_07560 [Oscillospiraceae bacterium]|jgi:hypothetical protein|nr:hypothetical protein [Oscillospiraceae bacterium]